MKSNFFKTLMMPVGVVVLGLVGAFTTMSMGTSETAAATTGYRFLNAQNPCVMVKECDTEGSVICKSGTITLWGKENPGQSQTCNVQLFERE